MSALDKSISFYEIFMKKLLLLMLVFGSFTSFASQIPLICPPEVGQISSKQALKWYRNSAEKTAMYNQGFNIGSSFVKNWVNQNKPKPKTWGVVLDIDETALDNSWYFKTCYEKFSKESAGNPVDIPGKTVSGSDFGRYVSAPKNSLAVPGAVDFTNLVHKLGGYVVFVSNRNGTYRDDGGTMMETTIDNLKNQRIYFDQILLTNGKDSKSPSDKNPRFIATETGNYDETQMVISNKLLKHKTIAYFGDNIQDFPKFKQKAMEALPTDSLEYKNFGNGYFIMPNPMYGSWEAN